jgi:hypothetical protein
MLLIALSAILFQRSATAPWAEARTADGRRMQVSPIGLADFGLGTSGTAPVECRWWPRLGDVELCDVAPGGEAAMTRLRRAYPLVVASLWTSVVALFLVALQIPRTAPFVGALATMAVPVLALSALWSLASSATVALSVLANAELQAAPHGYVTVLTGAILMAIAVGLLLFSRMKAPPTTAPRPPQ